MSFKIGCPMLKLTQSKAGNAGKHTGKLQSVLCEGWECGKDDSGRVIRYCSDADYDPTLTANNVYVGIRNAFELGKLITQTADDYSNQRRAAGGRGLRKTAAIGFTGILKPPAEVVNAMTSDQQERFRDDLLASFRAVAKDFIRLDAIHAVWQVDEAGGHWHYAGPAITPAGELNADKIVNAKLFRALNSKLPAEMRQRGWDVSDCVNYDPDRAKSMTPDELTAYKASCKAKRPVSGKSSAAFKADRDAARIAALEADNASLRAALEAARRQREQERKPERTLPPSEPLVKSRKRPVAAASKQLTQDAPRMPVGGRQRPAAAASKQLTQDAPRMPVGRNTADLYAEAADIERGRNADASYSL